MEDFEAEFTVEPREDFNFVFEFNIESTEVDWGHITGTLDDQTDLADALDTLDSQIAGNHQEITNIHNTIEGYGDIVSYNAADFATKNQGLLAESALQPNDNISLLNNNAGYITNSALNGYATQQWTIEQASALATDLQTWVTNQGYTSNVGTVTSVNNTQPDANGNVTISAGGGAVNSVNGQTGTVVLTASDVGALPDSTTIPTKTSDLTNDSNFVQNTATATNSLTILGTTNNQNNSILIGYSTTTSSTNSTVIGNTAVSGGSYATALGYYARANAQYTTAIGNSSYASYNDTTAIGHNSQATAAGTLAVGSQSKATAQRATSIGYNSQATQYQATALGYEAKATANSALQIGTGTNSTANTLQVGSYTLLDTSTGLIPDARISSNFVTSSSLATTLSDYATQTWVGQQGYLTSSDLSGYVQASNGNMTFANAGTEGDILYTDSTTGEFYGVVIGQSSTYGTGVTIGAGNSLAQNGYMLNLSLNGLGLIDASNMGTALLTVSNNNLAVNGKEIATKDDINALVARIAALEA